MQRFIILSFAALGLVTASAKAMECNFKELEHSNKRYVYPVYRANVSYFFSKSSQGAYALTNWEFDVDKTRECFRIGREQNPDGKLMVPPVSVSKVMFKLKGSSESWELSLFPLQNGHWSTASIMVPIRASSKATVADAISKNEPVVEFIGDPRMRISITEKKSVSTVRCIEKETPLGVLGLHKRLGEVKTIVEKMQASSRVQAEEALQTFLGKCVEFITVDAGTLQELEFEQKRNSRILAGEFSLYGHFEKDTYIDIPGITTQNASIHEI